MAKTIANLNIKLTAGTGQVGKDFAAAAGHAKKYGRDVDSVAKSVKTAIAGIAVQIAAIVGIGSIGSLATWGISLAADAEQSEVAFTTMLRSADEAKRVLGDLRDFAASTPFQFPELRDSAKSLIAFGVGSDQVVDELRMIGDVAAGVGAPINELATLYGKARVGVTLFAEDINQLTGRGIPIIQELAKQFGIAESEVKKLVASGAVTFDNLRTAFQSLTSEGGQFSNMMAAQSATLAGRWSTLKDNVAALVLEVSTKFLPVAGQVVDSLTGLVQWLGSLDATTVTNTAKLVAFAAGFAGVLMLIPKIVAGVRSVIMTLQALASAQAITSALSGPAGWAKLAIAAGVAAGGVALVSQAFEGVTQAADTAQGQAAGAAKKTAEAFVETADAVDESATALEAVTGKLDKLQSKAEQITDAMRTPFERFQDDMRELQDLMDKRLISGATFDRAKSKYREDLEKALETQEQITTLQRQSNGPVAAVQAGTSGAFSAVQAGAREWREQLKLQQQQLAQQRATTEVLGRIDRNTRNQMVVQQAKI